MRYAWVLVVVLAMGCSSETLTGPSPDVVDIAAQPDLPDVSATDAPGDAVTDDSPATPDLPEIDPPGAACLADPDCDLVFASAHRAKCGGEPENTLAGIKACIAARVPMLELDTRQTADGHVVLMHDSDVVRTTDGEERFPGLEKVSDLTLEQFGQLVTNGESCSDDPDANPDRCHPPSWDQVLAVIEDVDVVICIDLKASDPAQTIADAVAHGVEDKVVLFDSNLDSLLAGRSVHDELVVMPRVKSPEAFEELLADPRLPDLDVRWVHIDSHFIEDSMALTQDLGIRLYLNTFMEVDALLIAAALVPGTPEATQYTQEAFDELDRLVTGGVRSFGTEFGPRYIEHLYPD